VINPAHVRSVFSFWVWHVALASLGAAMVFYVAGRRSEKNRRRRMIVQRLESVCGG
jgi:hypothetical protein